MGYLSQAQVRVVILEKLLVRLFPFLHLSLVLLASIKVVQLLLLFNLFVLVFELLAVVDQVLLSLVEVLFHHLLSQLLVIEGVLGSVQPVQVLLPFNVCL